MALCIVAFLYVRLYFTDKGADVPEHIYDRYYVMITDDYKSSFWQSVYSGALKSAEENNTFVELLGSNLYNDYTPKELMEIAISSDVDGIMVSGDGSEELSALINEAMDKGIPVLFDTFSGHLNKLKTEFNGGKSVYLEQMKNVDMLILDDIGKEKISEWSQSIMFDVINYRYEHLYPIVMTTNLKSDSLKEYLGGAVWSRLCEMCSGVQTKGKDYRQSAD